MLDKLKDKITSATADTEQDKQRKDEESREKDRKAKSLKLVGKLVHYFPASSQGINTSESERLEKERRNEDPNAAIITSVQPDGADGGTVVNLRVWSPAGSDPAYGVDYVSSAKEGGDGTPFCYPNPNA